MYKTEFIDENWCVILTKVKRSNCTICIIPNFYIEDEALANTIASLLNENSKIVVNLSI